jgi:membrane-associated phospholipid phosphatase
MTTAGIRRPTPTLTAARALTEVFAPANLVVAQLFAVAVHATPTLGHGLLYGAVTAFFAGGLPYAILLLGIRRGHVGDRHIRERSQRPVIMVIGLVSVTVGLLLTWWLGAPRALFALVAAMLAGVVVSLAITVFWKISIHTATAAGTVAVLILEFGPALWAGLVLVAALAWARVALRDHTIAQVTAGSIVGFAVAASVMSWLR